MKKSAQRGSGGDSTSGALNFSPKGLDRARLWAYYVDMKNARQPDPITAAALEARAKALKPAGIVFSGKAYEAAANSTKAALLHIANGDSDAAYAAARQAASVMTAPHLYF